MNVSHKSLGLGMVALAVALMGSAAIADNGGINMPGMGGHRGGHMGMPMDFATTDANKDGKVTPEEFAAARTAAATAIDADKDGLISADELAAMHLKAMEARIKEHTARMIADLDTDGDGKLSAAEFATPPVPADAFTRADTNKDGAIDQAEADAMAQRGPDGKGDRGGRGDRGGKGHHGGKHHGGQMGNGDPSNN